MKFKKKKREIFLGNLRVSVDEDTEEELRPHVLVKRRIVNGTIFYHYADGSVEVKSFNEEIQEMIEEINAREKLK